MGGIYFEFQKSFLIGSIYQSHDMGFVAFDWCETVIITICIWLMTLAKRKLVFLNHVSDRVGMLVYSFRKITSINFKYTSLMCEILLSENQRFCRQFYQQGNCDRQSIIVPSGSVVPSIQLWVSWFRRVPFVVLILGEEMFFLMENCCSSGNGTSVWACEGCLTKYNVHSSSILTMYKWSLISFTCRTLT